MRVLVVLFIPIFLIGCAPIYVPNVRNVVPFEKPGEIQGRLYVQPLINFGGVGFDAEGAVSATKHIAFMGSFASAGNSSSDYGNTYNST